MVSREYVHTPRTSYTQVFPHMYGMYLCVVAVW